jgi:surface carbohydrate biosynthesis protein
MNLYLIVEVADRELDAKIFVGALGAARGYDVLICDARSFYRGVQCKLIPPGIVHFNSVTPSKERRYWFALLKRKGFQITASDEEAGLVRESLDAFITSRFSSETISKCEYFFCWGARDFFNLKERFPEHSKIFRKVGNPRPDIWSSHRSWYWIDDKPIDGKNFLLFTGKFHHANGYRTLSSKLALEEFCGFKKLSIETIRNSVNRASENYKIMACFIDAIYEISREWEELDIVICPHPSEDPDIWRRTFKEYHNVHIIREGSIAWLIHNCLGVVHSGCTSAIEAMFAKKPVLSFTPIKTQDDFITNNIGYRCYSVREVKEAIVTEFQKAKTDPVNIIGGSEFLDQFIFTEPSETASERMLSFWDSLVPSEQKSVHVNLFWSMQIVIQFFRLFRQFSLQSDFARRNFKFRPLKISYVRDRVSKIQHNLRLKGDFKVRKLGPRTVCLRMKK